MDEPDAALSAAVARKHELIAASPLFRHLDARSVTRLADESEIVEVTRGDVIMREGGEPDCFFVILQGSLEVFREGVAGISVLAVLGHGASVGEMGVLTREPRTSSVRARRDSSLIRIPAGVFETVLQQNAQVTLLLARTLSDRLKQTSAAVARPAPLTSIAVLRACDETLFDQFCRRLMQAFARAGHQVGIVSPSTLTPASDDLDDARRSFAESGDRLAAAVAALERTHNYVICACDLDDAGWSQWSIRQADLLLIVGGLMAGCSGAAWPAELDALGASLESAARHGTRIELALVRPSDTAPAGTGAWLDRARFDAHHHVVATSDADHDRLVRRLSGRAWGLVLGGGGARGFAHIGVIRALSEHGIPIDMIGGTSMGAILGAQWAMGCDVDQMLAMTRQAYVDRPAPRDLTLPYVALRSGRSTLQTLKKMFGDRAIEDLPTSYFCISCNLTRAETAVHDRGPVWFWARVSCAVPGLVPPVPFGGDLLVDGGLLDNLPVETMRRRIGGSVAASDVSRAVDLVVDKSLVPEATWSGPRQLFRSIIGRPRLPNIADVLMRTAEVSSVRDSRVAGTPADLHLRVPVDGISMTDFKAIDRIVALGYDYTARRLDEYGDRASRGERT